MGNHDHASDDAMDRSTSLANLRHLPSQPKVCSTTQRRGRTSNLFALSDRFMMSIAQRLIFLSLPFSLSPRIAAIGKDMQQRLPLVADRFQYIGSTVAVLDIGTMHHETDHQADRMNDDVALAALDLLARVIAPDTAAFRVLGALTIDHTSRRTCLWAL